MSSSFNISSDCFGIIYKITDKIYGKSYIGQKTKPQEKFEKYWGSGIIIKKVIKKHGIQNFEKEILCECFNQDELNEKEKYYIEYYKCNKNKYPEYGNYNLTDGGNTSSGYKFDIDVIQKIKKIKKQNYLLRGPETHQSWIQIEKDFILNFYLTKIHNQYLKISDSYKLIRDIGMEKRSFARHIALLTNKTVKDIFKELKFNHKMNLFIRIQNAAIKNNFTLLTSFEELFKNGCPTKHKIKAICNNDHIFYMRTNNFIFRCESQKKDICYICSGHSNKYTNNLKNLSY